MVLGHAPDTAPMSFDSGWSISCVMASLTALPVGSSSIVQRDGPSALSSGLHSFCHLMTARRGGSTSRISPVSLGRPSGKAIFHGEPFFQVQSAVMPNQYCGMKCGSVSADHNL